MEVDLPRYLARIGAEAAAPSPEALGALVAAQMAAIPFETIDPFLGRLPALDPAALGGKLLERRRGGWCFELNTLFGRALAALGYALRPTLGRVRMGSAAGGARTHLALLVRFGDGLWLADTGFGGPGPDGALPLGRRAELATARGRWRLRPDPATGEEVLDRLGSEGWFALYGIDGAAATPADIEAAALLCTRPESSRFRDHLMLARLTPGGRAALLDRRLTVEGREQELASEAALAEALGRVFGLLLPPEEVAALWRRLSAPAAGRGLQ